jgi:large subunit ribosomal protein L23
MKVLLAPVISEKATFVAEKNEQVVFLVMPDANKLEDQSCGRDAVQGRG